MRGDAYTLDDQHRRPTAEAEDGDAAPEQRRTGARLAAAAALAAMVFLVYELTASPMAAAIAGGLKFGWDDLAVGLWLFRRDPDRGRGITLGLVQASRGAYVASLVACGVAAAADFVLTAFGGGKQPLPLEHLIVFALGAAAACVALTFAWLILAIVSRQLVWTGGGLAAMRRRNAWPPRPRGRNTANALLGATAYFVVAGAVAAWCVHRRWQVPGWPGMAGISAVSIALGIGAAFLGGLAGRGLSGRRAEDVWPEPHDESDVAA